MSRSTPLVRRVLPLGLAAVLACLVGTLPIHAGTVYVPFTVKTTVDGIGLETQVWLTNSTAGHAQAEVHFIPLGADGTKREGVKPEQVSVRAGTTMLYDPFGKGQGIGLLEITLPDGVFATARLAGEHPLFGKGLGTEVPVVTSRSLVPKAEIAQIQGWERSEDGVLTDFGLVNLSHQENSCRISVYRGGGAQVKSTVLLPIRPLSMVHFADALGVLGETVTPIARAAVECDREFYTYSLVFNLQTGETLFLTPSGGGDSELAPPGQTPKASECSAGSAHCFRRDGVFFIPTVKDDYRRETFNLPSGSYSSLHLRLEVTPAGWAAPTSGLNLMWWLANTGRHYNLYGFSGIKGPGSNSILFRHGIGMEAGAKPKFSSPFAATQGQTYVFDYVYNPAERVLDYRVLDKAGNVLYQVIDRPNVNRVHIENGESITADFSHRLGINLAEPPSYGWKYANLLIEVFP
jgi:hypothetical protein